MQVLNAPLIHILRLLKELIALYPVDNYKFMNMISQ